MGSDRFEKVMAAIDDAHAKDPNTAQVNGATTVPYELHYARKMSDYLHKCYPDASEELQLAIRAQHFRRWEIPRASYPMTRAGYHSWRTLLKKRQAEQASQLCSDCGYSDAEVSRIAAMIRKENVANDQETQALEDVACLVFLDDQFEDFKKGHDEEKIVRILKKTWMKMSETGHDQALKIAMSDEARHLVEKALATSS